MAERHVPMFRLQIVDRHGKVVVNPFSAGPLEIDLIDAIAKEIALEGTVVSVIFRFFFKMFLTDRAVRKGIGSAIQKLKDDTRFVAHLHR